MSDYIRVTTQNIDNDREHIQNELEGIRSSIEDISKEMELLGQTWEGPAWHTFQNQVAKDVEQMSIVYDKLSVFLEHMEYAGKEYRQCARQVENLIRQIRV